MNKRSQLIFSGIAATALVIIFSMIFSPIYYANDDAMLQAILSGSFSGKVSSMTVYFNQPLSLVLSGFYALLPSVPWFGIFQLGCYLVCLWGILAKGLNKINTKNVKSWENVAYSIAVVFLFYGFLLMQMIMPTYTVTAAVVGASAVFMLILSEHKAGWKAQLKELTPVILLLFLCYLIRNNVFFMLLPYFAVAAIWCLGNNLPRKQAQNTDDLVENVKLQRKIVKDRFFSYLPTVILMLVVTLIFMSINFMSYQKQGWKEYQKYNDVRTLVYDYTGIAFDELSMEQYKKNGLSEEDIQLYMNYNIMLAEDQSFDAMQKIAEIQQKPGVGYKKALLIYKDRIFSGKEDAPYLGMVFLMYVILLSLLIPKQKQNEIALVILLAVMRSGLWIFLLQKGRYPERITVSLYLIELAVLFGFLMDSIWEYLVDEKKRYKILGYSVLGILCIFLVSFGASGANKSAVKYQDTVSMIDSYDVVYSYIETNEDNLYLLDVKSFSNTPEYIFGQTIGKFDNFLLLGGWMTKTPLLRDKLAGYGYESAREALLAGNHILYISKDNWLPITLPEGKNAECVDIIRSGNDSYYVIKVVDE